MSKAVPGHDFVNVGRVTMANSNCVTIPAEPEVSVLCPRYNVTTLSITKRTFYRSKPGHFHKNWECVFLAFRIFFYKITKGCLTI